MRLVLLGPPGAGKGTQAAHISARQGIPALSTGQLFDRHINAGTPLGRQAERYVRAGELVPDDIVLGVIRERLSRPDCSVGFVLDGFPRTVPQAAALDRLLAQSGTPLDAVINLDVDESEVLERIRRRSKLEAGLDDAEETARLRLKGFAEEPAPLRHYYAGRGLLRTVNGSGRPEEVSARIETVLADLAHPEIPAP